MSKKEYQQRYRERNREKLRADQREYAEQLKHKAISLLGGKCAMCGFSDIRALQIDHIKSVGNKAPRGVPVYREIVKGKTENRQVLCANCNWIKRYENKEYRAG